MLEQWQTVQTDAQQAAVIALSIPRAQIQQFMGPAIEEVMAVIAAQGIVPAGPVFAHYFKISPDSFEFEVGVPVSRPVSSAGRVAPGELPAATVARTVYQGPYEGLGAAWGAFGDTLIGEGYKLGQDLWEIYLSGPESSPDSTGWRTELNRPLLAH